MIASFGRLAAPAVALELMGWIFYTTGRLNADEFVVLLEVTFWYGVMAFGVACIWKALRGKRNNEPLTRPQLSLVPLGDRAGRFEGGERPVVPAAGEAPLAHLGAPLHSVLTSPVTGVEDTARLADGSPTHPSGVRSLPTASRSAHKTPRPGVARTHLRDVSRDL